MVTTDLDHYEGVTSRRLVQQKDPQAIRRKGLSERLATTKYGRPMSRLLPRHSEGAMERFSTPATESAPDYPVKVGARRASPAAATVSRH